MRPFGSAPNRHLFVCVNERSPTDPLGEGCGARGASVYMRLKDEVAKRGLVASTWVTRTSCLGVCPKTGCAVAIYPETRILREVTVDDVTLLLDGAT